MQFPYPGHPPFEVASRWSPLVPSVVVKCLVRHVVMAVCRSRINKGIREANPSPPSSLSPG